MIFKIRLFLSIYRIMDHYSRKGYIHEWRMHFLEYGSLQLNTNYRPPSLIYQNPQFDYKYIHVWIGSGDYPLIPPQPPGSLVLQGTEWPKFNMVIKGKYILWTMTSNSWTENEKHDIPSQILKIIFGLHASVIFRPQHLWFPVHL